MQSGDSPDEVWSDGTADEPASKYRSRVLYQGLIGDRDVMVPMRDGVRLCIDIFRPDTAERLPALLARIADGAQGRGRQLVAQLHAVDDIFDSGWTQARRHGAYIAGF